MKDKILLPASIIILAVSIVFGSIWIGHSSEKVVNSQRSTSASADSNVLNLSQAAKYVNMTEEEVQGIIQTEKMALSQSGSFSGEMFPCFTVDNKQYFYKAEIDEWIKEVSENRRQYDTVHGWVLQ